MKEATGELSGTVITVVAIAAVAAIFTAVLLPILRNNIKQKTYCTAAYGCTVEADGKTMKCTYRDEDNIEQEITCPISEAERSAGKNQ